MHAVGLLRTRDGPGFGAVLGAQALDDEGAFRPVRAGDENPPAPQHWRRVAFAFQGNTPCGIVHGELGRDALGQADAGSVRAAKPRPLLTPRTI